MDAPDSGRTPEFHATVTNNTVTATDVNAVTMISVAARNGATGRSDVRGNEVKYTTAVGITGINVREATPGTNVLARGALRVQRFRGRPAANNPLSTTTVIPSAADIPVVENNTICFPPRRRCRACRCSPPKAASPPRMAGAHLAGFSTMKSSPSSLPRR